MISSTILLVEVRKNTDLPWDIIALSYNSTLTVSDIQSLQIRNGKWNWDSISRVIPIVDVYTYPDLKWNRSELSLNKDIRVSDLIAWQEIPPSIYKR